MPFSTSKPWASPFPSVKWVYNTCVLRCCEDGMELAGWRACSGGQAAGRFTPGVQACCSHSLDRPLLNNDYGF